jgi:hypothetical protein
MVFPVGRDQLFQACVNAVSQCGFKLGAVDPGSGHITATAGMGMKSWGEKITITVGAEGRTDITSTCRGIQLVDYGKNKANLNALFAAIGQSLPAAG